MLFKRFITNTPINSMPRLPFQPKKAVPSFAPKPPSLSQMDELVSLQGKPVPMKSYPKPYPSKR